jgi:hypothetical protein
MGFGVAALLLRAALKLLLCLINRKPLQPLHALPACFYCALLLLLLLLLQSLDTEGYIAKKMERRLDKAIKFVLVSGKKALADAGLDWQGQDIKVR